MTKPFTSQIGPAILFGGIPFYIGAIFWFFPERMSKIFLALPSLAPKLDKWLFSPKAMKVTGVLWWLFGVGMWCDILLK